MWIFCVWIFEWIWTSGWSSCFVFEWSDRGCCGFRRRYVEAVRSLKQLGHSGRQNRNMFLMIVFGCCLSIVLELARITTVNNSAVHRIRSIFG